MKYNPFTRRMFLQGLGGYALSIPLLPSLMPKAHAQTASSMRFALIHSPLGRDITTWYPKVTDQEMGSRGGALFKSLGSIQGQLSPSFSTDWDRLRSKVSILRGLDSMNYVGLHNSTLISTGSSADPASADGFGYSIDCMLEESSKFYATRPMLGALRMSPSNGENWGSFAGICFTSKTKRGQLIRSEWSPQQVYNKLLNPANVQLMASKNQRMLGASNLVMENFKNTMNSRRIASADKIRLDSYMSLITEIDKSLAIPPVQCNSAADPGAPTTSTEIYKAAFQMQAAALACGVTKISMTAITHCNEKLDEAYWHDHAHGGPSSQDASTGFSYATGYAKWTMNLVAYYLNLLDSIPDGAGSLLDNTMFIYGNEDSTGGHQHYDLPIVMAGATGKLTQGNFVDYRPRPLVAMNPGAPTKVYIGRPYNNALVTALKTLGLGEADYQRFGLQGFGRYDNYNPEFAGHYQPFLGAKVNEMLPILAG